MKMEMLKMLKIIGYWDRCTISTSEDFNLDYPYIIDLEDDSVFYCTREERDKDFYTIKRLLPILS